jgi:CPA1 family monovalent cation:H+ antiporter
MIGLQLPYVLKSIHGTSREQLAINAAQLTIAVVLLRLIGVFSMAYAGYFIRTRIFKEQFPPPPPKGVFVIAWTGMRGVVALAAAIALPETLANGSPFPQRNMILFLTFCVIFVTLVLQGLTLPAIIRWFGLSQPSHVEAEERIARRKMIESALAQLKNLHPEDGEAQPHVYDDIVRFYQRRLDALDETQKESEATLEHQERYRDLTSQLRRTERATIIEMRDRNEIGDIAMRRIERELDLMDARFQ